LTSYECVVGGPSCSERMLTRMTREGVPAWKSYTSILYVTLNSQGECSCRGWMPMHQFVAGSLPANAGEADWESLGLPGELDKSKCLGQVERRDMDRSRFSIEKQQVLGKDGQVHMRDREVELNDRVEVASIYVKWSQMYHTVSWLSKMRNFDENLIKSRDGKKS
jgi:hypothetical protein